MFVYLRQFALYPSNYLCTISITRAQKSMSYSREVKQLFAWYSVYLLLENGGLFFLAAPAHTQHLKGPRMHLSYLPTRTPDFHCLTTQARQMSGRSPYLMHVQGSIKQALAPAQFSRSARSLWIANAIHPCIHSMGVRLDSKARPPAGPVWHIAGARSLSRPDTNLVYLLNKVDNNRDVCSSSRPS